MTIVRVASFVEILWINNCLTVLVFVSTLYSITISCDINSQIFAIALLSSFH